MADRFKVGYNMWLTNTGSSADFENVAQIEGSNGRFALFAPHVLVDYFGWNTGINVANLSDQDNNVSIQYFNLLGNATEGLNQRLAAHGMTYFYDPSQAPQDNNSQDVTTDVNAGVVASAIIWSDFPVAVAVDATKYPESDPNGGADLFQGTSYSATQNIFTWQAVPLVQKGGIDGQGDTSGINIMNPNSEAVTANVFWVNPSGFLASNFGVSSVTIPGFANGFVYTMTQRNLPNGFTGAAQVIASRPVAAVSANVNYAVDGDGSAIFNAFNPCGFFRVSGDCTFGDPFEPGGQSVTKTFLVDDGDDEDETVVGADAEGIAGVGFSIVNASGTAAFQRDGFSGVDGSRTFTNIPVGNYELFVTSIPSGFVLPTGVQDEFTVTEGSDVQLINELEFNQALVKTVCIAQRDEDADEGDEFPFVCDADDDGDGVNLAGVNVTVFEIIGEDFIAFPVTNTDIVFEGVTGADGTITLPLAPGDYLLCLTDADGVATTVPGGETVNVDLPTEIDFTLQCDFGLIGGDSPFGEIFEIVADEDTVLENPVFLVNGTLNVLVSEFLGDEGVPIAPVSAELAQISSGGPLEGIFVCIEGFDNNYLNCLQSNAAGQVTFTEVPGGDYLVEVLDNDDEFFAVCARGGELTADIEFGQDCDNVANSAELSGFGSAQFEINYDPTDDVVQDGVMDDRSSGGTYDLEILMTDLFSD
jgi:hypothetical protein